MSYLIPHFDTANECHCIYSFPAMLLNEFKEYLHIDDGFTHSTLHDSVEIQLYSHNLDTDLEDWFDYHHHPYIFTTVDAFGNIVSTQYCYYNDQIKGYNCVEYDFAVDARKAIVDAIKAMDNGKYRQAHYELKAFLNLSDNIKPSPFENLEQWKSHYLIQNII